MTDNERMELKELAELRALRREAARARTNSGWILFILVALVVFGVFVGAALYQQDVAQQRAADRALFEGF